MMATYANDALVSLEEISHSMSVLFSDSVAAQVYRASTTLLPRPFTPPTGAHSSSKLLVALAIPGSLLFVSIVVGVGRWMIAMATRILDHARDAYSNVQALPPQCLASYIVDLQGMRISWTEFAPHRAARLCPGRLLFLCMHFRGGVSAFVQIRK
eukprot:2972480-Amphidinium_carterae.1